MIEIGIKIDLPDELKRLPEKLADKKKKPSSSSRLARALRMAEDMGTTKEQRDKFSSATSLTGA